MKRIACTSLLAITLSLGTVGLAMAWHGHNSGHGNEWRHHAAQSPAPENSPGFYGHGGGHEQASGHGFHNGPGAQNAADYYKHGGGHEQAADNDAIHKREMQDPNHTN